MSPRARWKIGQYLPKQFIPAVVLGVSLVLIGCNDDGADGTASPSIGPADSTGPIRVSPGDDLQQAADLAASLTENRTLILSAGTYHPVKPGFCMLALTAMHDGISIRGEPGAVLTARSADNPEIAVVSHVIYCGHGLSARTEIKGITVTGSKDAVAEEGVPSEPLLPAELAARRGLFFQLDGGAVKVFGASGPHFRDVLFLENETLLCGGAVSIEQHGFTEDPVRFSDCRFIGNRCPATGAAIDVLSGGAVRISNCLFADNTANFGMTEVRDRFGLTYNWDHGCGALTVFPGSQAVVSESTFTCNWNAVDDQGTGSVYDRCIFSRNDAWDESRPGAPYELDVTDQVIVRRSMFFSDQPDLRGTVSQTENQLSASDPLFNEDYIPQNDAYSSVGYRPVERTSSESQPDAGGVSHVD